jgi:hypothetical protein
MNKLIDIGNHCIGCGCDTAFGSGNFVNRIPADDGEKEGYMCVECLCFECDRCDSTIELYCELMPHDVYGWTTNISLFSDGAYVVCEECLTREENELWELEGESECDS